LYQVFIVTEKRWLRLTGKQEMTVFLYFLRKWLTYEKKDAIIYLTLLNYEKGIT